MVHPVWTRIPIRAPGIEQEGRTGASSGCNTVPLSTVKSGECPRGTCKPSPALSSSPHFSQVTVSTPGKSLVRFSEILHIYPGPCRISLLKCFTSSSNPAGPEQHHLPLQATVPCFSEDHQHPINSLDHSAPWLFPHAPQPAGHHPLNNFFSRSPFS